MEQIYSRPKGLLPVRNPYCPGCSHSTLSKIIAEVAEEMGLLDQLMVLFSVGCTTLSQAVFNIDMASALHGRATSVGTGYKRIRPDQPVLIIQGDGDAASIGLSETIHTANRGEPLTVVLVNNQIFGMTGGQMAPTTLEGQKTTTSVGGRDPALAGQPLHVAEMIAALDAPKFVTRGGLYSPKEILKAKKTLRKALEIQINDHGYSFVEFIAACPVNWKMEPPDTIPYIEEHVLPNFPLGDLKG